MEWTVYLCLSLQIRIEIQIQYVGTKCHGCLGLFKTTKLSPTSISIPQSKTVISKQVSKTIKIYHYLY